MGAVTVITRNAIFGSKAELLFSALLRAAGTLRRYRGNDATYAGGACVQVMVAVPGVSNQAVARAAQLSTSGIQQEHARDILRLEPVECPPTAADGRRCGSGHTKATGRRNQSAVADRYAGAFMLPRLPTASAPAEVVARQRVPKASGHGKHTAQPLVDRKPLLDRQYCAGWQDGLDVTAGNMSRHAWQRKLRRGRPSATSRRTRSCQ